MISEFALEPKLVATWHDRKKYLFFEEKFGLKTGRILSAYPKKWKSLVWKAFKESPHGQDENASENLDALLSELSKNMVTRRNTFPEIPVWLEKAEKEHTERPFHAIVAISNSRGNDQVIQSDKLCTEGRHPFWSMPDTPPVPRKADELVAAVSPVLRVCRHIIFVDPYFDPNKDRFLKPMAGFLNEIWTNRYGVENPTVEIHTSIDRFFENYEKGSNREKDKERKVCLDFKNNLKKNLPNIIPRGKDVVITIWKEIDTGEKLHNRYILTEACGISFGTGLDQRNNPNSNEKDDLILLPEALHSTRWAEYRPNSNCFELVTQPFKVVGS